jgi:hypothetical protein
LEQSEETTEDESQFGTVADFIVGALSTHDVIGSNGHGKIRWFVDGAVSIDGAVKHISIDGNLAAAVAFSLSPCDTFNGDMTAVSTVGLGPYTLR